MIRRSAAIAVAGMLHQLIDGKASGWMPDQEMVLDALCRAKRDLNHAPDAELGDYLRIMSPEHV